MTQLPAKIAVDDTTYDVASLPPDVKALLEQRVAWDALVAQKQAEADSILKAIEVMTTHRDNINLSISSLLVASNAVGAQLASILKKGGAK